MGRSERAAALTIRRRAVATIKNVRRTRMVLSKYPFDARTFDALNGMDGGIEALLDRQIVFDILSEPEKFKLRQDLNRALDASENVAFEALRDATKRYFEDIQKAIDAAAPAVTEQQITYMKSTKQAAIEAFSTVEMQQGALDAERCLSTLEHLEVIAESTAAVSPEIDHELDTTETEVQEQHQHDGNQDVPVEEIVDPPDDDGDPNEEVNLEPGAPDVIPPAGMDNGSEENVADFTWVEAEEAFFESAKKFALPINEKMSEAGFDPEKAAKVLEQYNDTMQKYRAALMHVKNAVAPETCTADQLLRGSTKFYKRLDRLVSLVENLETLREGLNKSCESLMAASKQMMLAAIKNPLLA